MKPQQPVPPGDAEQEVSALIETLHQTGQRLEELTAGEVDTVTDRRGRTVLLRRAQDHMRLNEAAKQAAILNALPAHIALLDSQGIIISVNEAWRKFASANVLQGPGYGIGLNYLEICDRAQGDDAAQAQQVATGIRSVLAGTAKMFSFEYPCHSPTEKRWFQMAVTPLAETSPHGAVVMHLDITERKKSEEGLALFRVLMDQSNDAIEVVDPDTFRFLDVNQKGCLDLGYSREELLPLSIFDIDPLIDRSTAMELIQGLRKSGTMIFESRYRRKDGSEFPVEVSMSYIQFDRDYVLGIARDITERKAAEGTIKRLNRVYAVLSGINALIVRVRDRDELFSQACRIAVEAGGFRMVMVAMVDRSSMKIVPVASAGKDEALLSAIKDILSSSESAQRTMGARAIREKKAVVSNDSQSDPQVVFGQKYVEAGVRSMVVLPLIVSNEAVGVLALYASESQFFQQEELKLLKELASDVAFALDHINKQERLNYLAYYDVLTGLANRTLFLERVAQYLRSAASEGRQLALFLIDLERFKNINDSLGRPAGDELLRQVAQWLTRNTAGDVNLVARVGADLFAVVMPVVRQGGDLTRLLDRWIKAVQNHPFQLNGGVFRIAFKVGVVVFPDDRGDAETLFKHVEAALKMAKSSGERYLFYSQKMTDAVAGKLSLENQLRQALDNQEFVLHYQPKVNLASGKVTGVEALIRWNSPRSGLVPPGSFIPILEETGLIHEVGRWALRQAIKDYLRWCAAGLAAVRIAVNVSPLQLRDRGFIAEVKQAIGIDPRSAAGLELEITESLIMEDVEHSIASLKALRAIGISMAIDDFGTGFSSLSYLTKLPVDTLKIDRSFVIAMTDTPEGLALVSTIIGLAHALKLKVVAEGVETEEQARLLRLFSCDEMQGFFFSKPVSIEIFEAKYLAPATPSAR